MLKIIQKLYISLKIKFFTFSTAKLEILILITKFPINKNIIIELIIIKHPNFCIKLTYDLLFIYPYYPINNNITT